MSKRWLFYLASFLLIVGSRFHYYFSELDCKNSLVPIESWPDYKVIRCNAETSVTFDVDDTLIIGQDALAQNYKSPLIFKVMAFFTHPSLLRNKNYEHIVSMIFQQAPEANPNP